MVISPLLQVKWLIWKTQYKDIKFNTFSDVFESTDYKYVNFKFYFRKSIAFVVPKMVRARIGNCL